VPPWKTDPGLSDQEAIMKVVIRNKNINVAGFDYFTGDAPSIVFGGFGDKRTPVAGANFLNMTGVLPAPKLAKVKLITTTLEVEFSGSVDGSLFGGVKVPVFGGGTMKLTAGAVNDGKVKLMKLSPMGDKELIDEYNDSPAVLRQLIDIGGGARVVESVLIAVEVELHRKFTAGLSTKGSVIINGVLVDVEGAANVQRETTVKVEQGTCLGYSLSEPRWDATLDRNKTRVVSLRPDEHGL
jgi:hypothetical protein